MSLERAVDRPDTPSELERRNWRVAMSLVGWIVLLAVISVIVVWIRN